jgi:Mce-associated membrane protein
VSKTKTADPAAEEPEVQAEGPEARGEGGEPAEPEAAADESGETSEPAAEKPRKASSSKSSKKEPDEKSKRRLSKDPLIRIASLVTLIAAGAAAWFGWSYYTASGDDSIAYAAERDRVLAVAGQEIVNLNTLDYRQVDAGLKVWQDSATAQLYDQIVQGRERLKTEVRKAKTTSTAKILESGLTELDTRAGKAAVIAAVRITITGADGKPVDNTRRFAGQLTRTSDGWKLSALGQAPTGTP